MVGTSTRIGLFYSQADKKTANKAPYVSEMMLANKKTYDTVLKRNGGTKDYGVGVRTGVTPKEQKQKGNM